MNPRADRKGRRGVVLLATTLLAAAMACGGTVVGCGSSSGSSSSGGQDSGVAGDTGSPKADSGTPETGTADTGPADTGMKEASPEPQLGAPTFTPPGPAALLMGSTVTINPPSNLPTGGQLYWLATGAIPNPTTGKLYIGPIQVNQAETIIAIAHDPANKLTDSPPASAVYTITQPEAGSLGNVGFAPGSITEPNDFLVQLSGSAGATICYTLDGTAPTCNAGACTGTSKTYSAGSGGVSVDGTQTQAGTPPTGKLTITALQCEAGDSNGPSLAQNYQLIVADPTMVLAGNPVPVGTGLSNIPWPTGTPGIAPTISTVTNNSITVTDPASIWYNLGAGVVPAAPTCSTGTPIVTAPGLSSPVKTFSFPTNTTVSALGCKQGYAQSNVATFPFTIQENPPVLASGTNPYNFKFTLNEQAAPDGLTPGGIVDSANAGGADWICATNNGTAPSCGATLNGCGAAAPAQFSVNGTTSVANALPVPAATNTTTATTAVRAVACGVGVNTSTEVDVTYTLQLAPPFILTTTALGAGKPGWAFTTTGAPATAMTIPNGAGANYGPFQAYEVGDNGGGVCGFVSPQNAGPNPYSCDTTPPTVTTPNTQADYLCWIKNGTAACGAALGIAGCATGTAAQFGGGGAFIPAATPLPASMLVNGGDTISVIGCQLTTGSGTPFVLNNSAPTTVKFAAAGSATQPTIPPPANPYTQQAIVVVTNADANASTICFTTDGTAPSCGTTPSTQNVCQHGYCGVAGGGYDLANGSYFGTACDGTTTPADAVAPTGKANSSFTIPAGNNVLPGLLQLDGQQLQAIACNAQETPSPVTAQTYHFTAAPPDFTDLYGVGTGTLGDLDNGGTVGAGSCINLSSLSNFDLAGSPAPMVIAYSWTGPANCGSTLVTAGQQCNQNSDCASNVCSGAPCGGVGIQCGVCTGTSVYFTTASPPLGQEPLSRWPFANALAVNFAPALCAMVPANSPTATLSAVTCGNTTADQVTSVPRTAHFTVTTAQPIVITDQVDYSFGVNCTGGDPTCGTLHTPWHNPFNLELYDETLNSTLCYSTNGIQPSCNPGGGGCASGIQAPVINNQPNSVIIPFDGVNNPTGTPIMAVACTPGGLLANSPPLNVAPVLQVSPLIFTPAGGTLPCPNSTPNVTITQDQSAKTLGQGGPTGGTGSNLFNVSVNAVTCFTTDQSLPNVTATCGAALNSTTTCLTQNNAGTTKILTAAETQTGNLNTLTCVPGFQGTAKATPYTVPAYTGHITVDGLVTDWVVATPPLGESSTATNGATGLFSYDATKAYFGYIDNGSASGLTGPAIAIYIGNGTAAGGANKATPSGADNWATDIAPAGADKNAGFQRAFEWVYGATAIAASYTWNQSNLSWKPDTTLLNVTVGNTPGSFNVEFSVLLGDVGSPPLITSAGALYTNYGDSNTNATAATWADPPVAHYTEYYKDVRASCLFPNASFGP